MRNIIIGLIILLIVLSGCVEEQDVDEETKCSDNIITFGAVNFIQYEKYNGDDCYYDLPNTILIYDININDITIEQLNCLAGYRLNESISNDDIITYQYYNEYFLNAFGENIGCQDEDKWWKDNEYCSLLGRNEQEEQGYFPENITIDNNMTMRFDWVTQWDYYNLSDVVEEWSGDLIYFDLFDNDGMGRMLISNKEQYFDCDGETITRLIELNATDLLYKICIHHPSIGKVRIRNTDREEKHKIVVCWW